MSKIIAIIEDDKQMRSFIAEACFDRGYMVLPFNNYESYFDAKEANNIDLFLTDIFMDGIGGIEGIRKIREAQPQARIVAMSGGYEDLSKEDTLRAASLIGADHVLGKPFTASQLYEALDRLI